MRFFRSVHHNRNVIWNSMLFTFNTEGSDIQQAVSSEQWALGGHHPNWHPNGDNLIMNLKSNGDALRFCQFRYDGTDFKVLSEKRFGSGHPSIDPSGKYIITDSYLEETFSLENDEVPIRLVDLIADEEENICTINTLGRGKGILRLDPHPVWSRCYKKVCFNGAVDGGRQVFIADLSQII